MARRPKLNYENGTAFAVPLRSGGYGAGVVARSNRRGLVFGYFFGPRLARPEDAPLAELAPGRALYRTKLGDLGLIEGHWPILGPLAGWNPLEWPMPALVRVDKEAGRAWVSSYDDQSFQCIRETEITPAAASTGVDDGTMGYGAVEIRLTRLLG